ncbi:RNA helicase [Erysipelotrichaceae bacterium MTC7]|nr:RNA helicase [Erysipelotrichaceae bacterium MTC7]
MMNKFTNYGFDQEILTAIDKLGYVQPTKVQEELFPVILSQQDAIVKSQTGSGKTAAFALPILQQLDWNIRTPQVLVLTPTRELALQIKDDMFHLGRYKRMNVQAVFGKMSFEGQRKQLAQRTHVVVGTPGRVLDHLIQHTLDVSEVAYLVIDEADEMFTMGFEEEMQKILERLPKQRQTILLSATLDERIETLCQQQMHQPAFIDVISKRNVFDVIEQQAYEAVGDKDQLLEDVLMKENPDSAIIFCNTQEMVNHVANEVIGYPEATRKLHGGMDQKDRIQVITDFKLGYFRYLVATDVAARGLDIEKVELVINYDVPSDVQTYVHRIGRTGRKDQQGKAITLVTPNEMGMLHKLESELAITLSMQPTITEGMRKTYEQAFVSKRSQNRTLVKEKSLAFKEDIMKLHINAGKKTKMRPGDVVGAITSIEGILATDIGVISIVDVSTFVEILNGKGQLVFDALQDLPIKGRIRRINKANVSQYEIDYYNQENK